MVSLKCMDKCAVPAAIAFGPVGAILLGVACGYLIHYTHLLVRFIRGEITAHEISETHINVASAKLLLAASILSTCASLIGTMLMASFIYAIFSKRKRPLKVWSAATKPFWIYQILIVLYDLTIVSIVPDSHQIPTILCFLEFDIVVMVLPLQGYAAFKVKKRTEAQVLPVTTESHRNDATTSGSPGSPNAVQGSQTAPSTPGSTLTSRGSSRTTPSTAPPTPRTAQPTPGSTLTSRSSNRTTASTAPSTPGSTPSARGSNRTTGSAAPTTRESGSVRFNDSTKPRQS